MNDEQQHPSLSEAGEKMRADLDLLREAMQREGERFRKQAQRYIDEHPYAVVGAAFGLGFLLAGGLFSRATARTFSFGTRFLVGRLLRQLLAGAGAGFLFPTETQHSPQP